MTLNKVNYIDNQTVITAANLNEIQDAVIENEKDIITLENLIGDIQDDFARKTDVQNMIDSALGVIENGSY